VVWDRCFHFLRANLRMLRSICAVAFVVVAACDAPAPSVAEVRSLLDSTATFKDASLRVDTLNQDSPEAFSGEAVAPDGSRRKITAGVRNGMMKYEVKRTVEASAPGAVEASVEVLFGTIPLRR